MSSTQAVRIQPLTTQSDTSHVSCYTSPKHFNLFHIDNQSISPNNPTPRQLMIEKLRHQTSQLRQLKRAISSTSVSRLKQMKKIFPPNGLLSKNEQDQYRFERVNSNNGGSYRFTKNVRDLVMMGRVNRQVEGDDRNNGQMQMIVRNNVGVNPEILHSNDCITKQKSRQLLNKVHRQQQLLNQQSPSLITTVNNSQSRFFPNKHLCRSGSESNSFSTPKPVIFTRANSENHIRSSSSISNNRKYHNHTNNNEEMTLSIRKQLYQMQAKQRLIHNKIKLQEKQTKHKLEKKIKQNVKLLQKHKGLYEIIQARMQRQREKVNFARKRIQQRRFVHEGRALKVSIEKLSKKDQKRQQRQIIRNISQESMLNLAYSRYLKEKHELEKQQKLAYRLSFAKDFYNKDLVASRIGCDNNLYQKHKSVSTTQYL